MKPDWLIQINMDGVDAEPMIAEITAQGMIVQPIEYHLGEQIDFSKYGSNNDCVICYGDIDFVRQVKRRAPFVPGVWCNFDNLKCSTYYAHLGEYLLNKQYAMMPLGDLLRRWTDWSTFLPFTWDREPLFIRPDSGSKPFTGYIVASDAKHKIQLLVQAVGPETLIVVASAKKSQQNGVLLFVTERSSPVVNIYRLSHQITPTHLCVWQKKLLPKNGNQIYVIQSILRNQKGQCIYLKLTVLVVQVFINVILNLLFDMQIRQQGMNGGNIVFQLD